MNKNTQIARFAGILYVFVIVFGIFAQMVVRASLIIPEDATATVQQITSSESLFRLGFVSDLVMMVSYLLLAFTLYVLLKPVGKNLALLFLLMTVISVSIMCLNMLNQFATLLLLSGADYLDVYDANQLHAQVLFFMNLHKYGYLIAQIFFWALAFPIGIFGISIRVFPQNFGCIADDCLYCPSSRFFHGFPFPRLHRDSFFCVSITHCYR